MLPHSSTYRIQFNPFFPFEELREFLEYLDILGTGAIYASPVLKSFAGSMHGYDVVDPLVIDPELGGEKAFIDLAHEAGRKNMGWIQDIVPNHMAYDQQNKWLMDVLEKGRSSAFADYFDIDWNHPEYIGKIMVPFLGKTFDKAINEGEINLFFKDGWFYLKNFNNTYPVNSKSFLFLVKQASIRWPHQLEKLFTGERNDSWHLMPSWDIIKNEIGYSYEQTGPVKNWIDRLIDQVNNDRSLLTALHEKQNYTLCNWKTSESAINYRRFFTVNGLICLRMEDENVFKISHSYIKRLLSEGLITGLRIDHIDGLNDPEGYIKQLRILAGTDSYIVVEKILESGEQLPVRWKVQGTTGYDFLAYVNNLLTNNDSYEQLLSFYKSFTGITRGLSDIIYEKKKLILMDRMAGELDNLFRELLSLELIQRSRLKDDGSKKLKDALAELLIAFPVYRLYSERLPPDEENARILIMVLDEAVERNPSLADQIGIFRELFLDDHHPHPARAQSVLRFFRRFMQFTGPLMAKGVEDTTMYFYNCFIAHNEVGDAPGAKGITVDEFHRLMVIRQQHWPQAMNSTSTHDTKRGEDVRARLNVISDMPDQWIKNVNQWKALNADKKVKKGDLMVPSDNEEYLIYQTLAGIWPMHGDIDRRFMERLEDYFIKALREAKMHSAWNDPDTDHEKTVIDFIHRILDPGSEFLSSFMNFTALVILPGIQNSLTQLILKMTCPGIPDIYQGTELWDLSLVDPDNRQPVDYRLRESRLHSMLQEETRDPSAHWKKLGKELRSDDLKLWLTYLLLNERKRYHKLFSLGEYIPLEINGTYSNNFIAFMRKLPSERIIVIVPLHIAAIPHNKNTSCTEIDWQNTSIKLPDDHFGDCIDIIRRTRHELKGEVRINDFADRLPLTVLRLDN